ncbi:MAG: helix-turn-helix domain-containing protein [Dokdonella sp.]
MPAVHLREEFARAGPIQDLLLRFAQSIMVQMGQTVVCNRHHNVDRQPCRWLLMSLDRLPTDQLNMTQDLIGSMLGVRREAVTEAAGKLQRAGIIQYSRGRILVLDRSRLEESSCECYEVVRRELDRLLPWSNLSPSEAEAAIDSVFLRRSREGLLIPILPSLRPTDQRL